MNPLAAAFLVTLLAAQAPSPPDGETVQLRVDLAADERAEACIREARGGRRDEARACLRAVLTDHPDTTAALRARAALDALGTDGPSLSLRRPPEPPLVPPGRLELAGTLTAFGVYNGAATALVLGQAEGAVPGFISLTGGAVAVGLGAAFGAGSYLLADGFDLSAGDARLIASSVGWGTGLGLAMTPWLFSLAGAAWPAALSEPFSKDFERGLAFTLAPTALLGYAGLAGGVMVSSLLELEPAQVATINTGGLTGFSLGLAFVPMMQLVGLSDPLWLGAGTVTTSVLGLLGGFGAAHLLHFELGEVWLTDLGAGTAYAAIGGAGLVLVPLLGGGPAIAVTFAGATVLGTLASLVGTTAVLAYFKAQRGESASRVGELPFEQLFAPPTAFLDREGALVPLAQVVSLRF